MTSKDSRWKLFECKRCGHCCEDIEIPYDPKSIHEIADYFKITVREAIEKYYGKFTDDDKSIDFQENKRLPCPFLSFDSEMKSTCKIYPVRPYGCRDFPFETMGTLDCPEAKKVIEKLNNDF